MRHPLLRFFEAHPFVRLVLPLMAGIAVADAGDGFCDIPYMYVLSALLLIGTFMFIVHKTLSWDRRAWFGVLSLLFFFTIGFACCTHHWRQMQTSWPTSPALYTGQLTESITEKPRSYLCPLHLTTRWQADTCQQMNANVLLYLPKDSTVSTLLPGQTICFYGTVKPPTNFNPQFDYVRYLHHRQVTGTLYTRHWKLTDATPQGWKAKALLLREKLRTYYQQSGITGNEGAVFSALTLGYKKELSEEVRTLYNVAGASHVLALSGLHIGILCAVLASALTIVLPGKRLSLWRKLLVLPLVWAFVFVVGFPVSAVRAAIMFSLLIVGSCFTRIGFSLNTLALTAFSMLLYNPFYLFDVGFQMSFAAVASLLLLQPWLEGLLPRSRYAVLRYAWSLTTVSVAAQVGVFPLILFYFSRFSPYTLLVNLWVVPITFFIVSLSVPFLLLSLLPWPVLQECMANVISSTIRWMNTGLALCNRLPGADISGLSFSASETICLYASLFFLFYGLIHQQRRCIIGVLACLCVGVFCRIFA